MLRKISEMLRIVVSCRWRNGVVVLRWWVLAVLRLAAHDAAHDELPSTQHLRNGVVVLRCWVLAVLRLAAHDAVTMNRLAPST